MTTFQIIISMLKIIKHILYYNMSIHENDKYMRQSMLVRIDSKDRSTGSASPYEMRVNLNDYMLHNIRRILLKSVFLPNTQYNINANNNQLTYDAGAGDKTITIPVGQYTVTELLDEMIVQFAAEAPAITMTYVVNSVTKKIQLTFGGTTILRASSIIAKIIGMGDADTANLTVHNLPNMYNLSGLQKVYIGSNTIAKGTTMSSSDKSHISVFTEIPITVDFGEIQHRVLSDLHSIDEVTHSVPFNISDVDITLYDQDLNVVDLNGLDYQIVLKVFG